MDMERVAARKPHDAIDIALHDEIMRRAYELYERQHNGFDNKDVSKELQSELSRVAYAAAQIQMSNGELNDDRTVRAARVYLRALTSFIAQS